jgi:low affinity Fe/Cu permease
MAESSSIGRFLAGFAERVTDWAGSNSGFATAVAIVLIWAAVGPIFGFSDTWQLVINTGTTIVTFLMVFLIQRTQNKDALAIHLKLNELVAALEGASNTLVDVEALSEDELRVLKKHYALLARLARHEVDTTKSHSVDEAKERHSAKRRQRQAAAAAAKPATS